MCIAAPGKIVKVNGQQATVQYPQEQRLVMTAGEKVKVGDMVLVQMGIVVQILTGTEAKAAMKAWKSDLT